VCALFVVIAAVAAAAVVVDIVGWRIHIYY
jgi:hypothetical protein